VCAGTTILEGKQAMTRRLFFNTRRAALIAAAFCGVGATAALAQLPSFPGAEGYGGTFTGAVPAGGWFNNAEIYHVTTTQDYLLNGKGAPGTLRGAFVTPENGNLNSLKQRATNRIVVFDVGGTFKLTEGKLDMKEVNNIYIAGQTAPSPVTVYNDMSQITHSPDTVTSNVILRYMTFRKGLANGSDAITFAGGNGPGDDVATNMIIDHVSASWSEDEVLSVTNNNTNVTVQYTMMTDSMTSGHEYGSLIRPKINSNVSFHHDLYGNDKSRNPRLGSYNDQLLTADIRNNVIYNWSDRATYAGGNSDGVTEYVNANYVGNYGIAGPATPSGSKSETIFTEDAANDPIVLHLYQSGNFIDSDKTVNPDQTPNGSDMGWDSFKLWNGLSSVDIPLSHREATPFSVPAVTTQSAPAAYDSVINHVGNWWWDRDIIDERIIGNVQNNTQPAGGVPATAPVTAEEDYVKAGAYPAAPTTRPAAWDTENNGMYSDGTPKALGDGMPAYWELEHGLNPNVFDAYGDFDSDGYINVVEYLNDIGAFPAPTPIVFNGATNSRYAQITNWKTDDGGTTAGSNWQPSRFDEAQINSGTVVVDSVGQHAGLLKIGSNPGDNATLNITSGWLKVEDTDVGASTGEVIIGADPGATAVLTLSGGELYAGAMSKGAGGSFAFNGGELHADVVNFDLVNNGGTLAPGASPGHTQVNGDYDQLAGSTLEIEISSLLNFDAVDITGTADLAGLVSVLLDPSFTLAAGNSFQILTAATLLDSGIALALGGDNDLFTLDVDTNTGIVTLLSAAAGLAGDYNDNGTIDAADYTAWRDAVTAGATSLTNDPTPGTVDESDFTYWRAHFGETLGSGSGQASGAVPEPTSLVLMVLGVLFWAGLLRPRSTGNLL
jgi:hypothetical protein